MPSDRGSSFRLADHRGSAVVLYFYPEDDTEGCTIENLEFSALSPEFAAAGAVVVGISPDTIERHCRFRDRHGLSVMLLADPGHQAIGPYGAWGPKKLYGRAYDGLIRTSIVVDAAGRVAGIHPARRIKGHAARMLEAVHALRQP